VGLFARQPLMLCAVATPCTYAQATRVLAQARDGGAGQKKLFAVALKTALLAFLKPSSVWQVSGDPIVHRVAGAVLVPGPHMARRSGARVLDARFFLRILAASTVQNK